MFHFWRFMLFFFFGLNFENFSFEQPTRMTWRSMRVGPVSLKSNTWLRGSFYRRVKAVSWLTAWNANNIRRSLLFCLFALLICFFVFCFSFFLA